MRRTYDEWCDYLMYIPAALDGKLSIVREELRNDLRSAVQMPIVLVLCVRGSKPYTCAEGKKLWQDGFLLMYQHVDAIAKIIQRHGGGGEGGDGSDDDDDEDEFNRVLAELAQYELATGDQDYFDGAAGEAQEAEFVSRAGVCLGGHAVGPTDVGQKHKAHLIHQYVAFACLACLRE